MSIAKVLQLIKGESAHWINDKKITKTKFGWADEYYAVSVSESALDNVRKYINGQEAHHKKVTFAQEYEKFIRNEALDKDSGIINHGINAVVNNEHLSDQGL